MIPFLDLQAQYRGIETELEAAVLAALRSCHYVLGPVVERFEEDFARFCGTEHAVAVSSGTAALHLALLAAGIGPGDEVITVSTTFVATVAAILYTGATPVLVDIDRQSWNMDPYLIEAAITPRTKAILPVHLHGRLCDMWPITEIARRHGLIVIEDAAQAHGAERGRRAGGLGTLGCFSFYPGKNLGACGEGGAVTTDDPILAERLRSLRDWGQQGRYNHVRQGFNFRMDALQGAALGTKLKRLEAWNDARRRIATAYDRGLPASLPRAAGPFGRDHACHVYAILVPDRLQLQARLAEAGISTNIHYPRPVHLQPAYAGLGYKEGDLPLSESYSAQTLSLPIYPEMPAASVQRVIDAVCALCSSASPIHALA